MSYKEKVTCLKCNHIYERDTEILKNRHYNIEIPVQIAIIKKSKCKKCKSDECKVQFTRVPENIIDKVV